MFTPTLLRKKSGQARNISNGNRSNGYRNNCLMKGREVLASVPVAFVESESRKARTKAEARRQAQKNCNHYQLGVTERARRNLQAAEEAFEAAVRADPTSGTAHFQLASLRHARGDLAGAEESYATVRRVDPNDVETSAIARTRISILRELRARGGRSLGSLASGPFPCQMQARPPLESPVDVGVVGKKRRRREHVEVEEDDGEEDDEQYGEDSGSLLGQANPGSRKSEDGVVGPPQTKRDEGNEVKEGRLSVGPSRSDLPLGENKRRAPWWLRPLRPPKLPLPPGDTGRKKELDQKEEEEEEEDEQE